MGIFKDIVDVVSQTDFKKMADNINISVPRKQSLAKLASEGTLQFPVLVSRSLDIETLQMICKALERNYATFAQIAFSLQGTMNVSKHNTPAEFIKKFHQNVDGGNITDILPISTESSLSEIYSVLENENIVLFSATYEGTTGTITAKNKEQLVNLMDHVRRDTLNDKYVPKVEVTYNFSNKDLSAKYNAPNVPVTEKKSKFPAFTNAPTDPKDLDGTKFEHEQRVAAYNAKTRTGEFGATHSLNKQKAAMQYAENERRHALDNNKFQYQKEKDVRDRRNKYDDVILNQNVLKDNDVKKANELIATTLHIRVKQLNDDNETLGLIDFIIGIKATMHPIKSEEMVTNVVRACENNNKMFNFIRWTSGEISFFKDFLFNIKEIKTDIVNRSAGASFWWIALKRRKALAKVADNAFISKKILPNATIVLSIEEVEMIKSEYGFDLFSPIFINKIMQTYFLLGFVIVDNSSQIAHFMFDGKSDFESVSFSGLEKENSANERKLKDMLKIMGRN